MQTRFLVGLVFAMLVSMFAFPLASGAQETTDASSKATQDESSDENLVFAKGGQTSQADAQATTQPSGPLAGTRVDTISTDSDQKVERITIPRPDCTARQGASLVVQDDDGTQGDLIDNTNVQITEVRKGLEVTSDSAVPDADIEALNVRGGDKVLDNGGLVIVTSTDIKCNGGNPPPPTTSPEPTTSPNPTTNPEPTTSPTPEPQDKNKGPLAGGTAIGKDVLVPGDVIRVLPDGTKVVGIDQIIIRTENCKLTARGNDLTITMSDQGVPFRLRDGQNVDITIKPDGTIVANGRRTLGDEFPSGKRDNPTRIIVPIPVDPENDQFSSEPNNRFPIISSTGIDGKGCHVLEPDNTGNNGNGSMDNGGTTGSGNDVVPNTTSDHPLPNTGGVPLYGVVLFGLVLAGAGVLLLSRPASQPVSASARRRRTLRRRPPSG